MQTNSPDRIRRGYYCALAAAATGGAVPTLSKLLLPSVGPVQLSAYAFLFSGLALVPLRPKVVPGRNSLGLVLAVGLIGAAAAPVLYQFGLNQTTAVNASLLSNGEVFFTAIFAFSLFHERLARRQIADGLLIIAGIIVVSTNLELSGLELARGIVGNVLILGATALWSLENNLSRIASERFGALFVTKYRNMVGGAVLVAVMLAVQLPLAVPVSSLPELILMVALMAATSLLAIAALGMIGAVRTILAFSTTSLFGSAFALIILGEPITAVQVSGGVLILLGVYLVQRSEGPEPKPGATTRKT